MLPKPAPEQPPRETFVFSRIATSLASSISASSMIAVSGRLAAGAPRGCSSVSPGRFSFASDLRLAAVSLS